MLNAIETYLTLRRATGFAMQNAECLLKSFAAFAARPDTDPAHQPVEGLFDRSAFLEYLEDARKNAAVTRNVRLAAIKSFFRFLEYRQPAALEQIRSVLAIPFKKTDRRLVPYLRREELQAVLDAPDPATRDGIRDRAMLHLAVCAGLRVSDTAASGSGRRRQEARLGANQEWQGRTRTSV